MKTTTINSLVTFGINSICQDGKHVIFIDVDNKNVDIILSIVKTLQKENILSDFYLFSTHKGFHAICLDKFELHEIIGMLIEFDFIDHDYLKFAEKRNNFTLRWGIDKEYYDGIYNKSFEYKKSYAHYVFLKYIIDVPVVNYSRNEYDNSSLLEIQAYRSEKNGWANIKL